MSAYGSKMPDADMSSRMTFVIDRNARIAYVNPDVDARSDAQYAALVESVNELAGRLTQGARGVVRRQAWSVVRRPPVYLAGEPPSLVATSGAQYVITMSAPARTIAVSASSTARCSSIQPRCAAALTIEYSPLTL